MASQELTEIITRAETLNRDEQLALIAHLIEHMRGEENGRTRRRDWRELEGIFPYPALGEDAQEWVTRTRREADEAREIPRRGQQYETE